MNKKANTVIFILCGTVVNLLLAFAFIAVLLVGAVRLQPVLGDKVAMLIPVAFIGGLILAMFVYQKLTKWVVAKFKLDDKLDPIFKPRSRNR